MATIHPVTCLDSYQVCFKISFLEISCFLINLISIYFLPQHLKSYFHISLHCANIIWNKMQTSRVIQENRTMQSCEFSL